MRDCTTASPSSEGIFSSISSILASACSSCLSSCSRIGFSLCSASFSIPAILPFAVRMARILALNSLASASASSSSGCFQFFPERSLFFTVWLEKSLSLLADVEQVLYVNVVSFVRQLQYFHCCRGYCSDSLYCFIRYYGFGCC